MKIAFELIGLFIVSLLCIAVPILCALSFVYDWFAGLKLILFLGCIFEWISLMCWLTEIADNRD